MSPHLTYQLAENSLEFRPMGDPPEGWSATETLPVFASQILRTWNQIHSNAHAPGALLLLRPSFTEVADGRSDARVFLLSLTPQTSELPKPIAKFIVRVLGSAEAAAREKDRVHELARIGGDYFSSNVLDESFIFDNVVVYQHAENMFLGSSKALDEFILALIREGDEHKLEEFANALQSQIEKIFGVYRDLTLLLSAGGYARTTDKLGTYSFLISRLPADLYLLAGGDPAVGCGSIVVPDDSGASLGQGAVERLEPSTMSAVFDDINTDKRKWFKILAKSSSVRLDRANFAHFEAISPMPSDGMQGKQVRLRMPQLAESGVKFSLGAEYAIVFATGDGVARSGRDWLQDLGFRSDSCLRVDELRALFDKVSSPQLAMQHSDLHAGNILVGNNSHIKVIDLGGVGLDILGTDLARLEVSLWHSLVGKSKINISVEETTDILDLLWRDRDALDARDNWTFEMRAFFTILRSIRRGAIAAMSDIEPDQLILSYTIQLNLFQRYIIEENEHISPSFSSMAAAWFSLVTEAVAPSVDSEDFPISSEPTLLDLWADALRDPALVNTANEDASESVSDEVNARGASVIDALGRSRNASLRRPLTDFQQRIWHLRSKMPFRPRGHVILAGPTSTGKTTVAKMFLVGSAVLNSRRTCALYIAPTRALAQTQYQELLNIFQGLEDWRRNIVLLTGEDSEDRWRVAHGQFRIACMVYENANILFSENRELLHRIGCIVVDEMHMLADLHRGPVLELALTKALQERQDFEFTAMPGGTRSDRLHIVSITTEDGADEAIQRWLTVQDAQGNPIPPLVIASGQRPVPVNHWLVTSNPKSTGKDQPSYRQTLVARFADSSLRTFHSQALREIERRLPRVDPMSSEPVTERLRYVLVDLLIDKLRENPFGYRALVFIPGRAEALDVAQRLRNKLDRLYIKGNTSAPDKKWTDRYGQLVSQVQGAVNNAENNRLSKELVKLAGAGLMLHHSDIEKSLRWKIEEVCSTISAAEPSQVILATETLSYGVNLAVHDVYLLGVQFYSEDRMGHTRKWDLSPCAFHNMAGRAGRLGKTASDDANFFIMVPRDMEPSSIVRTYYTGVQDFTSSLYVADDTRTQSDAENSAFSAIRPNPNDPCSVYQHLGALDFSNPFSRSVLDALRHLSPEIGTSRRPVPLPNIVRFYDWTLYGRSLGTSGKQGLNGSNINLQITRFGCALERILEDCAGEDLRLVEVTRPSGEQQNLYAITPRGEAIIDTGTELRTVKPLLRFVNTLNTAWADELGENILPVEIYILALLMQEEVYSDYLFYTPECTSSNKDRWRPALTNVNSQFILDETGNSLMSLGVEKAREFSARLVEAIDSEPGVATYSYGSYDRAPRDGILRLFNAMVSWVQGHPYDDVRDLIERKGVPNKEAGVQFGDMQGFRQFREKLAWRTVFLARMLSTARPGDVQRTIHYSERDLALLADRLRFGCIPEAIPLFQSQIRHQPLLQRREVAKLLAQDVTPLKILSASAGARLLPIGEELEPGKFEEVRTSLGEFAVKQFEELSKEMTIAASISDGSDARQQVDSLWDLVAHEFKQAVRSFHASASDHVLFDQLLRQALGNELVLRTSSRSLTDRLYRVVTSVADDPNGVIWESQRGQRSTGSDDLGLEDDELSFHTEKRVRILGTQVRDNWMYSMDGKGWMTYTHLFNEIPHETEHLVIVPIPWLPTLSTMPSDLTEAIARRFERGFTTTFLSPAALCTMLSCIVRDFESGEESTSLLVSQRSGEPFRAVGVQDVVKRLRSSALPATIREKLLSHFEVDGSKER